jgi:methylmalonyl-CoA mutase N-terminal domain/subunit
MLGCVLGGAQAAWVTGYDEGFEIPSQESLRLGIRTAQVIGEETSIPYTVDPLAGSYYVECLTDEIEEKVKEALKKIDDMGGSLRCIKDGYYQREILKSAYEWQKGVENGAIPVVGLNKYIGEEDFKITPYEPDPKRREKALESLEKAKKHRDATLVKKSLQNLRSAAGNEANLMPFIVEAAKAYCTVGEISEILRDVYGPFKEISVL